MNKSQLREFAIRSRVALLGSVKLRAFAYGITEEKVKQNQVTPSDQVLNTKGELLSNTERLQRDQLLRQIAQKGYAQVMEEAAYTWFNRFIALRYMENAMLLPIPQRVFVRKGEVQPELLTDALHVSLDKLESAQVIALLENNENEQLYKLLLITLSNDLHRSLPQMFEEISNYTELLFPDGLLQKDSVLAEMAKLDEDTWQDIQVIGWLYQYYNTELKDETFALLKKNVKITKERIGAATQLFTPEWIVRYMVENSLGRLWLEGHCNDTLQSEWKYYLPEAEQEPEVAARLAELRKDAGKLLPEQITVIDPCMGSGHILVAAFDVLMDIYRTAGYQDRDAVPSILANNLYGLDIDDRAAQLAYFAVMMKACQYDRRYLRRDEVPQPHVCAIQESNALNAFDSLQGQLTLDKLCVETANDLIRTFHDAKEYGSILDVQIANLDSAAQLMEQLRTVSQGDFELNAWLIRAEELLPQLAMQAEIMQRKYDVVVTNPPYRAVTDCAKPLADYVKESFPSVKTDLYSVFIHRCLNYITPTGFVSMVTMQTWMFLASFKELRKHVIDKQIVSMVQIGYNSFPEMNSKVAQAVMFCLRSKHIANYRSSFIDLNSNYPQNYDKCKAMLAEMRKDGYFRNSDDFLNIDGYPFVYWMSETMLSLFGTQKTSDYSEPRIGLATGNNELYLRTWFEVSLTSIGFCQTRETARMTCKKWFPYNKGGEYRKWYGNQYYVINWENDGAELQTRLAPDGSRIWAHNFNLEFIFKPHIAWSYITTSALAFRAYPQGFLFDSAGTATFTVADMYYDLLAYLNSSVVNRIAGYLDPTMHFTPGEYATIPYRNPHNPVVSQLGKENVDVCKADWDSFETSWDFQRHPLIQWRVPYRFYEQGEVVNYDIESAFENWQANADARFRKLKANEEELNRIFIDIYGLQDELTPEVADKDVTVRRADLARDIRSLISYAVGCMMGRYSLDVEGLAYAGGKWDAGKYTTFLPDKDAILPIADDEYFEDDIVNRFVQFIEVVYGAETLEQNLRFIADALGGQNKPPKDVLRAYFLNDFYKDHLKVYQKRPIYWLFDSGKQNGFKALVYLHRYDRDTLARLRTDYVHPQQERLRTQIDGAQHMLSHGDAAQRSAAAKRLDKYQKQLVELGKYEEQLHHLADERITLDLDDGVKVNYAKMGGLVAAIK